MRGGINGLLDNPSELVGGGAQKWGREGSGGNGGDWKPGEPGRSIGVPGRDTGAFVTKHEDELDDDKEVVVVVVVVDDDCVVDSEGVGLLEVSGVVLR